MKSYSTSLLSLLLVLVLETTLVVIDAFIYTKPAFRQPTRIFLEDWVADMIDGELHRQHHKKDFEKEWMEKNRGAVVLSLNKEQEDMMSLKDNGVDENEFRQLAKDRKMAQEDPAKYCADRCVTTGNCDALEEFFDLSAQEVITFCNRCVLNDGEEPCDIPDAFFYEEDDKPNISP